MIRSFRLLAAQVLTSKRYRVSRNIPFDIRVADGEKKIPSFLTTKKELIGSAMAPMNEEEGRKKIPSLRLLGSQNISSRLSNLIMAP